MVGMEQLEVHSKSYLVRWINVSAGHTISWSIQPHKKSLNFGVFRHPGGSGPGLPNPNINQTQSKAPTTDTLTQEDDGAGKRKARREDISVVEKLEKLGMKSVHWLGRCEADKVTIGHFDVADGEGGMYGLVFDNTFSKQLSKTVTFVLMTYPTEAPPVSGHHLHPSGANPIDGTRSGQTSPALGPRAAPNSLADTSATSKLSTSTGLMNDPRPRSSHAVESKSFGGSSFFTGTLHKQRRKHHSFAKRFFSLDFTTSTLSYYQNRNSSALRGSIPLSLAVISTDEQARQICVDSGAEVWHLRANNQRDFIGWRDSLARAQAIKATASPSRGSIGRLGHSAPTSSNPADDHEWGRAEQLLGRISGIRDAVRRLAQDQDPKYKPSNSHSGSKVARGRGPSESGYFDMSLHEDKAPERLSFWKRKTSGSNVSPGAAFRRSVSAQHAVPSTGNSSREHDFNALSRRQSLPRNSDTDEEGVHEHCLAIMRDLDQVVFEFSQLISDSKHRRAPPMLQRPRRDSTGSNSSEEFFDAEDVQSAILQMKNESEDETEHDSLSDGGSDSEADFEGISSFQRKAREGHMSIFPSRPKSLVPLPLGPVQRRKTIAPPKVPPPSLISFLRKNVGKDLSTIAMPVSSNEPTSLCQRIAEQMEYSELLDAAATSEDSIQRLLKVTAFAVSSFSGSRVKERAIRKPFNPMLGETYELVREDKGYRFIAEKISHRPVRMACQAEAGDWTFLQAPMPVQKFWGKSAELNTDGRARVLLHTTNETFSWILATSFLRNVIAGEKYVEPVSTMTVVNETSGHRAVATFKAGGMFAGRSEEVSVACFDRGGQQLPQGLGGKWTSHLNLTNNGSDAGKCIWQVGDLVEDAPRRYGFTAFAAALNEITKIEEGKLPVTDSRLRPDQRALEDGDVDRAEALKARLEERQRGRRRVMEEHGEDWVPKFFVKAGAEGQDQIWSLKTGKDNYWERRAAADWTGVVNVLET